MTNENEVEEYLAGLRAADDAAKADSYATMNTSAMGKMLAEGSKAELLEHDGNRAAIRAAHEWVESSTKPSLLLHGPVGAGKTFLAGHVLNHVAAGGTEALWISLPLLVEDVRGGFSDAGLRRRADDLVRRAQSVAVLFLDDLGKTYGREVAGWLEEFHWRLIDPRYSAGLPTVATTEWSGEGLDRRVGAAVRSRLEAGAWVLGLTPPADGWRRPARIVRPG